VVGEELVEGATGGDGTGEEEAVDVAVSGEGLAGLAAALHHVEDAGGEAGVFPHGGVTVGDAGGELGGFEDDGVSGEERGDDVAVGEVAGEVERAEDGDDAVG